MLYPTGHQRTHGLKFQSVMTPNGLIANLSGPYEGKRFDAGIFRENKLAHNLSCYMNLLNEETCCLYGDAEYPINQHLLVPFKGIKLTAQELEFNRHMSSVRQCVEWGFNKVTHLFAFLDFKKKNLKLYLQPVHKYYLVGAFLANCHTCLYPWVSYDRLLWNSTTFVGGICE